MSSGNMCPEKKNVNNMKTNTSELISRNQKPIMPMVPPGRSPAGSAMTSDARKAAIVGGVGPAGKVAAAQKVHQRKGATATP